MSNHNLNIQKLFLKQTIWVGFTCYRNLVKFMNHKFIIVQYCQIKMHLPHAWRLSMGEMESLTNTWVHLFKSSLAKLLNIAISQGFIKFSSIHNIYSILFYPITLEGRRGTTDEFATIPFHLDLFSAALVELAKSIPVHSLILSSHLFFCLPLFLFPFTVPCRIVFAKPEDLETWPHHLSFCFLTRVRSSSYSPMAAWIFLRTSSLVTWSLYEMFNSLR